MNWEEANKFIARLNKKNFCGYSDWRLPTIYELLSLIDYTQYNPTLPKEHPFTNVQSDWYWSSTTSAGTTDGAWSVSVNYGSVGNYIKSIDGYVWPVRSGQCGGVLGNSTLRFTDNGDGTVTDNKPGLMWTKDANIQP